MVLDGIHDAIVAFHNSLILIFKFMSIYFLFTNHKALTGLHDMLSHFNQQFVHDWYIFVIFHS